MKIFWYLPSGGSDGHYLGTNEGGRTADFAYMQQIAQAADKLGFQGALLPTGRFCEDAWVLASALLTSTQRLKFLVAFRPGLIAPALAARTAATFDYVSKGRLLVNIVSGGSDADAIADGIQLDHDARYELTDEFLTVYRGLTAGGIVNYDGKHIRIKGGHLVFPQPVQKPYPGIYFGGSSEAAQRVAAKHADVYLQWAEPPAQAAEQIARVRRYAEEEGRTLRFGLRLHIIVRETESKAWDAANDLIKYLDDKTISAAQQAFSSTQAVGQHRMQQLHNGDRSKLEVSPNLWAGVGLARGGAGTAFVGDPKTIARRIEEYAEIGVDRFILSGYPHLEEAYRTAELLFPHLQLDHEFEDGTPAPVNRAQSSKDWDFEFGRSASKATVSEK